MSCVSKISDREGCLDEKVSFVVHSGSRQLTFHDLETVRACLGSGGISIFLLDQSSRLPSNAILAPSSISIWCRRAEEESMEESRLEETDARGSINGSGIDRDDSVSDTRLLPF